MRVWIQWACAACAVLGFSFSLWGQTTGQITGTVTDTSGAIVPGATVRVQSPSQGINRIVTTNGSGNYLVAGLPYGVYNLQVSAHGFKTYLAKGVVLRTGEKARANVALQVGAVTSTITVSGAAVAKVQLESATVSTTVNARQVGQLELNGRNFAQLVMLVPGVVNVNGTDQQHVGVYGGVGYNINGGRSTENNWEIDGANVQDNGSNGSLNVYPSIDAIAQVRVLSSNYGAQYARDASGTVLVQTKSGSNQWHGDAYEFFRNKDLNARNFFAATRSPYSKNDFGFTVGGPIIKNKTFIFWSSEWRRSTSPVGFNLQVPSVAERSGNFNDVCPASGPGVTPATVDPTAPTTGQTYAQAFPNCPTQPNAATPSYFPGNQVAVSPDAAALLPLISLPNSGSGASSFFISNPSFPTKWYESMFRIDQNLGSNWHVYYQFIHDSWNTVVAPTLWSGSSFPTIATNFQGPGVAMVAHLTGTLSPTLTNEFIAAYTADHINLTNSGPITRPSTFTMPGLFANGFDGGVLPGFTLCCNPQDNFKESNSRMPWDNSNPTYSFRDQINQITGSHNLYYGAEFDAAQKNEVTTGDTQGFINFANNWPGTTGNALADMFTGQISSFFQANNKPKYYDRYKTGDIFFQDDWHATPRLTLDLGMQIDLMGGYTDKYNITYNFDPAAYSAANAPVFNGGVAGNGTFTPGVGNLFDGLVNCGHGSVTPTCNNNHLWNWAPRLGFAWDVFGNGTTSLRGGYGIFYDHTNSNDIIDALRNPPTQLIPTVFHLNGYNAVAGVSAASSPLSISAIPTVGLWPMVQQWNLDVEHQFATNVVGELAYVGSHGTHLMQQMDFNQIHPVSTLAGTPYGAGGALAGQPINCSAPYNPATAPPRSDLGTANQWIVNQYVACGGNPNFYVPYIGYGGIDFLTPGAISNYNALQASLHGSFGGLFTSIAYTFSHALDDSSSRYDGTFVNSYDLRSMYASSNFDVRNNFSMSWVYQLPFARGNAWLGGWEWSGSMTAFTGTPFTVVNNSAQSGSAGVDNTVGTGSFVDVVGNPYAAPASKNINFTASQLYYNPAAFALPVGLTFGNEGRNAFRNPGLWVFDMGVFKNFKISERQSIQIRGESFNTFNHTNFTGLNNGITSSNFLRATGAHDPRIVQLAVKYIF